MAGAATIRITRWLARDRELAYPIVGVQRLAGEIAVLPLQRHTGLAQDGVRGVASGGDPFAKQPLRIIRPGEEFVRARNLRVGWNCASATPHRTQSQRDRATFTFGS